MSGTKQKSHFKKIKNKRGLHGVFYKMTINHYKKNKCLQKNNYIFLRRHNLNSFH